MSYMSGCAYHLQVCAHVYLFSDIPYIQHQSGNKEDLKTTFKFPKLLDKRSEGVLPQTKEGDLAQKGSSKLKESRNWCTNAREDRRPSTYLALNASLNDALLPFPQKGLSAAE